MFERRKIRDSMSERTFLHRDKSLGTQRRPQHFLKPKKFLEPRFSGSSIRALNGSFLRVLGVTGKSRYCSAFMTSFREERVVHLE